MSDPDVRSWTPVCAEIDLAPGEAKSIAIDPPVAVWNVDGELFATDDTCTHEKYSLADGYLDGYQAECALHWAKFDVRNGDALTLPATRALRVYPIKVEDGVILVDLTSRAG